MASLSYAQLGEWQELIIALNKNIIFVNPNDLQIYKEVSIPEDLAKCDIISIDSHADDESQQNTKSKTPIEPPSIQHVQLSSNGILLAVTTAGQKALLLYQCRPEHAKLVSVRSLARASSAISFSANDKQLLVTDKTGDCYLFDCENYQQPGKLILGHLSVVYDVLLTPDEKFVITCDRDDKIRVSNFPNCCEIEGYCLGHKEFVSAIKLLPFDNQILLSISGDESLKLWNYREGRKLCDFKLPAPGIKCTIKQISENTCNLAVLLYQPNESVVEYEINKDSEGIFHIKELTRHSFDSIIVSGICYAKEKLYIAGIKNERFVIELVASGEKSENSLKVLTMISEYFENENPKPEDVSGWFRKNFDNVTEYYERKKRRIEEKSSKQDD
ncbi:tRNA (guanine-N(7)-)-methyltransferase non-catalytic subunit wuho [Episyrphus balteatus]|uniref:tRNA (guanine-N(7)-)-methyltransferase non-catalytic subunit wuho n=1 Tax=Episyrphus balteatus TaxID=286459 RepID=UPI002485F5D1|nr:tRNA (guanine-N(7)-)-methyltransferase non-catalytic subunit wuho [Episyrphus balteatus]